ncbi:MAG: peptidoglycan DD-metalloendopeptidase family protein [Chitinophagales bacterium]
MIYPYNLVRTNNHPIFGHALFGNGVLLPLSNDSMLIQKEKLTSSAALQAYGEQQMNQANTNWAISEFGENRETLFRLLGYPQMVEEERFFHLGIDVWLPQTTILLSPFSGKVVESIYETRQGDYGGMLVVEYNVNGQLFYVVFGHLDKYSMVKEGTKMMMGESVGRVGGVDSNGGYFLHTHLQVLTERGYKEGFAHKGYATKEQFSVISNWCWDPTFLLFV